MSLYAFSTFLIGICLIAFLGFVLSYTYSYVAAIGYHTSLVLGAEGGDPEIDAVKLFFDNVSIYITVFMFIVLGIWVVVYSQRKGGQVYGEV